MAKPIEKIFNECLARIEQGETIESCLQRYPEEAAELQHLLTTFVNVKWRASMVQPRPDFKARARMQLPRAMYAVRQDQQIKQVKKSTIFSLHRALVPTLICIFFLLFSSVGTAAAASNAMPDQPLYPIKLATEQVQLALSFSDTDNAITNVRIIENRSKEIATMVTQGKTEQVIVTTNRLINDLDKADIAIKKVSETNRNLTQPTSHNTTRPVLPSTTMQPPAQTSQDTRTTTLTNAEKAKLVELDHLKKSVEASMKNNITVLEGVLDKSPETAKPTLQKAIDASRNKQEIFKQNLPNVKLPEVTKQEPQKPNNTTIPHKPLIDPDKPNIPPKTTTPGVNPSKTSTNKTNFNSVTNTTSNISTNITSKIDITNTIKTAEPN